MKKKIKVNKYFAGGLGFPTKAALVAHCKDILYSCELEFKGQDYDVVVDVLKMHPRYSEKVGRGDYQICIVPCRVNTRNNTYIIKKANGEVEDFSYYKAVSKYTPETRVKNCFRKLVSKDHKAARLEYLAKNKAPNGKVFCEETKLKIKPSEAHLDHYPLQFEEIVGMWFSENGLGVSNVKFNLDGELESKEQAQSFIDYHKAHVKYRLVMNKVNLQRGKANTKLPK